MQLLQDSNQSNPDNLNNVRREAIGHFRKKRRNIWELKIDVADTNSKKKNVRDLHRSINDFKKIYQPGRNIVKDKKGE